MGLGAGIGKRQLLDDYYFDEIFEILSCRYNSHSYSERVVDVNEFF